MKKTIKIESSLEVYSDKSELPETIQSLMEKAHQAREHAYAPYSQFQVGAALLLDNGHIVIGSNQENASYPSGLCAERTAIYQAGAQYPDERFIAMAITAKSNLKKTDQPIPPCGACRQAIAEYEIRQKHPITLYFMGENGTVFKSHSLENILPFLFTNKYL